MKWNSTLKILAGGLLGLVIVASFQNCGKGFSAFGTDSLSSSSTSALTIMDVFKTCDLSVGSTGLIACLDKNKVLPATLTQAQIDTCDTNLGALSTYPRFLAMCLATAGTVIPNHRDLVQSDIESCTNTVGAAGVEQCLLNRGVLPAGLIQADIDSCVSSVGLSGVEKCLRKKLFIPKLVLTQGEVTTCVELDTPALTALCLSNKQILPANVTQANIDTCVASVGAANIVTCLENNNLVPKVLMQPHVVACNSLVGESRIGACLNANGLLGTIVQTDIDDCVTKVGFAGVTACLVNKKLLTDFPTQAHFDICSSYTDQSNIANCLAASGVLLPGLLQTQIDACITSVGESAVVGCLTKNAYIASFSQMNSTAGVFGVNCSACHNPTNGPSFGNLDLTSYTQVMTWVKSGDPASSQLYSRMINSAAPMPSSGLLPAAESDKVKRWILQGSRNN